MSTTGVSIPEAARRTGHSASWFHRRVREGSIRSMQASRRAQVFIHPADVEAAMPQWRGRPLAEEK